jgi:hypothetical protein
LSKSLDDMFVCDYVAIKDVLRARAADFVDSAYSSEVGFTDMLEDLSQDVDGN